jgi:CO/xanthine dehydrogenase FAD-binding subunit
MKAARFDYLRPGDLHQAVAALGKAEGGAKLLAGGQSLGPMLNLRLARPSLVVDVSRLESHRRHRAALTAECAHRLIERRACFPAPLAQVLR